MHFLAHLFAYVGRKLYFCVTNAKKIKAMSTFTLQIPAEQVGWFEQMAQSLGWAFSKKETITAAEKRTRKAIEELENGKGTVCQSFEDYLKAIA